MDCRMPTLRKCIQNEAFCHIEGLIYYYNSKNSPTFKSSSSFPLSANFFTDSS